MRTFREHILYEEFKAATGGLGVWMNPSEDEIDDIPADIRVVGTAIGDMFFINKKVQLSRNVKSIKNSHLELVKLSRKLFKKKLSTPGQQLGAISTDIDDYEEAFTNLISFVRNKTTNELAVADDDWLTLKSLFHDDEEAFSDIIGARKKMIRKLRSKNPLWQIRYSPAQSSF